jgi:hypothetical protein
MRQSLNMKKKQKRRRGREKEKSGKRRGNRVRSTELAEC